MRILLSAFLLLYSFGTISAQSFSLNQNRMYELSFGRHLGLSMESLTVEEDSIWIPNKHWYNSGFCHYADSVSVLGAEIRISPSGEYRFVLAAGDTVSINPGAETGTEWQAYTFPDEGAYLLATMEVTATELVLGEQELIKTISFQKYSEDDQAINSFVNDFRFKFGEISGLVEFPLLIALLNPNNSSPIEYGNSFRLSGLSGGPGVQNITTFDVFDFQLGDIIHFEYGSNSFDEGNLWQISQEFISRTDYADSIEYEIDQSSWNYQVSAGEPNLLSFQTSVISTTIRRDSLFDLPPYSPLTPIIDNSSNGDITWLESTQNGIAKQRYMNGPLLFYNEFQNCFEEWIDWGCYSNKEVYLPGLGGPYYYCESGSFANSFRNLLYYSKGEVEWGEPLSVQGIDHREKVFTIYPNPTSETFRIEYDAGLKLLQLKIFDLQGREVRSYPGTALEFNLQGLKNGMYQINLYLEDGKVLSQSLLKN